MSEHDHEGAPQFSAAARREVIARLARSREEQPARPRWCYVLAHLKTHDRNWFSLHLGYEDAERQLRAVAEAWDVWFTPDDEPVGVLYYGVEEVPLLGPEESCDAPEEPIETPLTDEEYRTWEWLGVRRDVPGGLSANELANDSGITIDVATLRLIGLTARGLAHEVNPDRYRVGSGDA